MATIGTVTGDVAYRRRDNTLWSKVSTQRHVRLEREGRLQWVPVGTPQAFDPTEEVEVVDD